MRELFKALSELEANLIEQHGVSLNEAMALCCIGGDRLTASAISEHTGLSASHTSKVIRSIEDKELIVRSLGDKDKRQMYFTLSDAFFFSPLVYPILWATLFSKFQYVPAFAVSSILVLMAIVILVIRRVIEYRGKKEI